MFNMFKVKIKIKQSSIHNLGIFADEDIMKGREVYIIEPNLDLYLTEEEFKMIPIESQDYIKHFGYLDKNLNIYHLSYDDIRFCNHSAKSNIELKKNTLIAKRNIQKGEELTQDYNEFENIREELK